LSNAPEDVMLMIIFQNAFLLSVILTNVMAPTGVKGKKRGKNEKLG